ncbi:MAG: hypothetical protein ACI9PY_000353 [Ascidiaceihabitans sp.]
MNNTSTYSANTALDLGKFQSAFPRFNATRSIILAMCLGLVAIMHPIAANAKDLAVLTIDTCLELAVDQETILKELKLIGWQRVVAKELSDANIQGLAALGLNDQLGNGTVSAVRWKSTWELRLKNAGGNRRLKEISGAANQNFWFEKESSRSILQVKTTSIGSYNWILCQIGITSDIATESFAPAAATELTPELPPIFQIRDRKIETDSRSKTVGLAYFQSHQISEFIQDDFPYIAVAWVLNSTKR